jgi:hypothetical protein
MVINTSSQLAWFLDEFGRRGYMAFPNYPFAERDHLLSRYPAQEMISTQVRCPRGGAP